MEPTIFTKKSPTDVIRISKLVTVYYNEYPPGFYFQGESHDFWEFFYCDKGTITLCIQNRRFTLTPDQAVFIHPNDFHQVFTGPNLISNSFIISFECNSKVMQALENKVVTLTPEMLRLINMILSEAVQSLDSAICNPLFFYPLLEKSDNGYGGLQVIRNYLELLLISTLRSVGESSFTNFHDEQKEALVKDIIAIMEQNLYGTLDIQTICRKINYGKTFISTIFKDFTGESLIKYYLRLKNEEAKKLISETDYNCTEISNMLHFCNPHYFTMSFKKHHGVTPSEFAKTKRKKRERSHTL